jgi:hypothetical protein
LETSALTPLFLEAVDVGQEPVVVVDQIWMDGDSLWAVCGLLDRLWIDPQYASDHAAVDPDSAPRFAWRWLIYTRGDPPASLSAEEVSAHAIYPNPPREFCIDPVVLGAELTWLEQALDVEGLLKRETLWTTWLRLPGPYVPERFGEPFRPIITRWRTFAERAAENGHRVVFRFDLPS